VEFVEELPQIVSLETLRQHFLPDDLWVVRQGNRLSVIPVDPAIALEVLKLGQFKTR
jgi:predicted RNA-binding protein with PUA-like domain